MSNTVVRSFNISRRTRPRVDEIERRKMEKEKLSRSHVVLDAYTVCVHVMLSGECGIAENGIAGRFYAWRLVQSNGQSTILYPCLQ